MLLKSEKIKIIFLSVFFLLSLNSCNEYDLLINHWYLQKSTSRNSQYAELIFDRDSVNIYRNGSSWTKIPYKREKNHIFIFNQDIRIIKNDEKILELENGDGSIEEYQVVTLNEALDLSQLRKFQYNIKKTAIEDSLQIQRLKNELWIFMGGTYDTLNLEEDIYLKKAQ